MIHDRKFKTGEFFDLEKLPLGYAVHDMHDGQPHWAALFGPKIKVVSYTKMDTKNGDKIIDAMKGPGTMVYCNKLLVFVGTDKYGESFHLAYSYDGHTFGMYTVTV